MQKKSYIIRVAQPQDAKALDKLMKSAYAIYDDVMEGITLPPVLVNYADEIAHYPTWVLVYAGQIIGGLIMVSQAGEATLSNIAVDPLYMGQGFGRILMDFAEHTAPDRHYRSLHLATHVRLTQNIAYYTKLGYREVSRDQHKVAFCKTLK